ncbi:unnamed protein product, partial [marine sediment metagenome]
SFDFVYVGDVARANIYAMESSVVEGAFNVGKGVPTTIKELTGLILELTGSDLKPEYSEEAQSFVTKRLGSTEKALVELGFRAKVEAYPSILRKRPTGGNTQDIFGPGIY